MAMAAQGSVSQQFSCGVVKGTGNTKLSVPLPLQAAVKITKGTGLNCKISSSSSTTKSKPQPATSAKVSVSQQFSCGVVKGAGNTKVTIPSPLQAAVKITKGTGLNCKSQTSPLTINGIYDGIYDSGGGGYFGGGGCKYHGPKVELLCGSIAN